MPTVHAAILAHGDRPQPLAEVLRALEVTQLDRIVIFANAVAPASLQAIARHRSASRKRIDVDYSTKNLGSAGGYARAVGLALDDPTCDAVWLLDDDNVPRADAFAKLSSALDCAEDPSLLFACRRMGLPEYANLDARLLQKLPRSGSCVGFHFGNLIRRAQTVPLRRSSGGRPWLLAAPYGGLLVPRSVVERHGGPDPALFLYADDIEWTTRLTSRGCRIDLMEDACIDDATEAWNAGGAGMSNLRRRIELLSPARVYYETRNRNWLALNRFPTNRALYIINRALFLMTARLMALRVGRLDQFRLLRRAIRDSELGILGEVADVK